MYELGTLISFAAGSLIAGLILGYFVLTKLKPEQQSRAALEKQINEMHKQQLDYQTQVSGHFDRTAELLNDLAESYRNVHNHIAKGAQDLHGTGISPLQPLPEGRPVLESKPGKTQHSQQPLDYAPRQPGSPGALHEEFGLEKNHKPKEEAEPPAPPVM
ncbi:YhcB family protein [Spongiibacter sp. KMU-158]|uniref:Z-ring associated protein G n=1 Tax=Spongiibacter pelagi TaxID=2760804 RepID=A0A927C3X9_9GAMM|nr:YhcB family protein [Spongiibacter pelagi]MBD2859718.1 YhcB family protein [Spongiibacter pelagi]